MTKKTFAIRGGATGIGAALKQLLLERGDQVIVIDLKDSDIKADLSTQHGCDYAVQQLEKMAPDGLDGFVPCAGVGPHVMPLDLIPRLNFFGAVRLIQGTKPLLMKKKGAVVVVSSNSASLPGYNKVFLEALANNNEEEALSTISALDGQTAYGGSKYALAVWMRRQAPLYMKEGVRMNAVAPGITGTAMTDGVFKDQKWGQAIKQFSEMTPYGQMATPVMIAKAILFLLDPSAEFICGSVLFVDGGTDALLRPESF